MEVVNKLCAAANELSKKVSEAGDLTIREAVSSVPTYLNTYIIRCISACGEPDHCNSTQYRQVRMLCVFISTLIRNRALEIQPLSSELKSFCLSFSFVKEALSLYKTII
ncbi:hypothetical protein AB6A40_008592 [Gnathostoma spinigerum]|uniref:CCR4-NOT transcription complex subunit 11 n=1 Tax=Gnathostoma spinigerum TaxID=75299 RepID=A0ABD6EXT0_9BILA